MATARQQEQIDWRRAKVLDMLSKGETNYSEIARYLQVDRSCICKDVAAIRKEAIDNLQHHIHEKIPEEYRICMTGMKDNLKQTLEIAETVADPKVKLQARAIANDCYKYIMDLTTNGIVVNDALKYIQSKVDHLTESNTRTTTTADKEQQLQYTEVEAASETETQTHNGVF